MFRIRCSANGQIMSGTVGLTDVQKRDLGDLQVKSLTPKGITEKQNEKMDGLIHKRDNPVLPKTAKSYCEKWVKEQLYQRRKYLSNKYLDKGIYAEDDAIDYAAEVYKWPWTTKNEKYFENEYLQGTPDIILKNQVIDIKCSWDCFTFPLFETETPNEEYFWQLQGYMILTRKEHSSLVYCLMDAPANIIESEARVRAKNQGFEELEQSVYEEVEAEMTYSNLPDELRIKKFPISLLPDADKQIKQRVEMCREYIKNVLKYEETESL